MELKPRDRIVQLRVVYYGPAVCGKTTNLQMLHAAALGRHRGELITVNSQQERTILFDLLPLRGIGFHGFDIRFQLVGVPGQAPYGATRRLVMRGTDAVVFVANSAADRLDDNLGSLAEMNDNLRANALDPATIPIVFQYNKRDLPDVSSVEELNAALNARGEPALEAVAVRGEGVIETLGTLQFQQLKFLAKNSPTVVDVPNACSNSAHRRAGGVGRHSGQRINGGHLDGAVGQGDASNGVGAKANGKDNNQDRAKMTMAYPFIKLLGLRTHELGCLGRNGPELKHRTGLDYSLERSIKTRDAQEFSLRKAPRSRPLAYGFRNCEHQAGNHE